LRSTSERFRLDVAYQRARLLRRVLLLAEAIVAYTLWLELHRGTSATPIAVSLVAVTALIIAAWRWERRAARRLREAFDHLDGLLGSPW
jgi:hypothetical protein